MSDDEQPVVLATYLIDYVVPTEDGKVKMITKRVAKATPTDAIQELTDGGGDVVYEGDPVEMIFIGMTLEGDTQD